MGPVGVDDHPEVEGGEEGEEHVGEPHPQPALQDDQHAVGDADGDEESREKEVEEQQDGDRAGAAQAQQSHQLQGGGREATDEEGFDVMTAVMM